jgi:hypothetical protein
MNTKPVIWICLFAGSAIGQFVPYLWGAGGLSFSSIILSAVGGIAGVWVGY